MTHAARVSTAHAIDQYLRVTIFGWYHRSATENQALERPTKGASQKAPLPVGCKGRLLENEFQRKLDLPRIVRRIASRADFAKRRAVVVSRAGNRHHAIAAETGSAKVWMVGYVKELRAELQILAFRDREVLKDREVQSVVSGPRDLRNSSQRGIPRQRHASRGIIDFRNTANSKNARLHESLGVTEPTYQTICSRCVSQDPAADPGTLITPQPRPDAVEVGQPSVIGWPSCSVKIQLMAHPPTTWFRHPEASDM